MLDDLIYIEICERGNPSPMYHACIKGNKGLWGQGHSIERAIDDLLKSHPEYKDIDTFVFLKGVIR